MYYWATQQVPLVEQDLLPIERNIDYPHFLFKLISFECCIGIFCLNCHDLKGPCNTLRGLVITAILILTCLLLLLLLWVIGTVVVSTTTSGSTIISCDEYCVGSSDIVVREISDGILGYSRLLGLLFLDFLIGLGEGSGDGVGIRSPSSFGRTYKQKIMCD